MHMHARGKLLWKKRTKIFGIKKSRQFFSGFWDFFPKFKGFWDFFQLIFSADFFEIFSLIFFRRTFSDIFCDIELFLKLSKSTKGIFTPIHDLNV
jgi:hypothetical protein